ncbi:MAG: HEAT repeat domain-containing protein [Bryobacter sp.]|nr:HEAT repeat domain-containing protein [Bryobacter sp. CoA8 C33]
MGERTVSIRNLERVFLADPKEGHERLKQFCEENRVEFLRQAIAFVGEATPSSYSQVVQQFCQKEAGSLQQILFTADLLSLDEVAQLLRIQNRNNPAHQVSLMQSVKREIDSAGSRLARRELMRLIEIFAKSIEQEKLGGMLASLCEHSDERLRSKVAVLSGVVTKQLPRQINLLKDIDPRVRANAVQALWGLTDPESLQLMVEASRDDHHRVAANALLGRYMAGDIGAVQGLFRLVREVEMPRQLAGAWAIGETGDPRFLHTVGDSLGLRTGRLKLALRNAGRKIRKRMEDARSGYALSFEHLHSEFEETGRVRIHFCVQREPGVRLSGMDLKGTGVIVHDGSMRVDQIGLKWVGKSEARRMAVIMPLRTGVENVFAQELVNVVGAALRSKRAEEAWAILKYGKGNAGGSRGRAEAFVEFFQDTNLLRNNALRSAATLGSLEEAVPKLVESIVEGPKAEQHLLLMLDPELTPQWQPPANWQSLFERNGIVLSVLDFTPLEGEGMTCMKKLVHARGGTYHRVKRPELLAREMEALVRCMQAHYYLTYQLDRVWKSSEEKPVVSVEAYQPDAYGRMILSKEGQVLEESSLVAR